MRDLVLLVAVVLTPSLGLAQQAPKLTLQQQAVYQRLLAYNCSSNPNKCQAVCEAADDLEDAARSLSDCAGNHDYSDDCSSQFGAVRDAQDSYETAVTDADGDCE